ncbi:MAG: sigma-70 family RNA polymerase sigma factor [Spirosomataceae bacterium]
MTDEAAMTSVSEGNLNQAAVLYERYKRPLFNFFLRYGLVREQSQDLTQQVFVRLIQYRHTFKQGYVFKMWIYRIARNVYHDYLKDNPLQISDLDTALAVFEEKEDHQEQYQYVQKALSLLPDDYREVLVLSRYEGLNYEEIADLMECSVANVKVRVHRAIKKLREVYFQLSEQ